MIVRIWLATGVLLPAVAWVLMVPLSPEPFQDAPGSNIAAYRAQALMPAPGHFTLSREIGHEVFEIPEEDAQHRGEESAMEGPAMEGRAMEGMDMSGGETAEHTQEAMSGMGTGGMKEAEHAEEAMSGMGMGEMKEAEHAEETMSGMAMGGMEEGGHSGGGLMVMPAKMAGMADRTIEIEMREWGFSPSSISVKAGEVIHFKVRNRGNMPHEFMFMPPAGMAAVNYRLERADWNLTEHEASFERALVLPGDGFETVIEISQPGVWMFMCMFPYHMQFGMMGVMKTEGATMGGMNMDGMKM